MKRTLPMIVATATALGACHAFAHDREVILNYSDPHGVDLALALGVQSRSVMVHYRR